MKLTIGETSVFEVEKGVVTADGSSVKLHEIVDEKIELHGGTTIVPGYELVVAYQLKPGDKVRRIAKGEYAVEY